MRTIFWSILCFGAWTTIGQAAGQTAPASRNDQMARLTQEPPATAPLETYVRVVSGDSLDMFYELDYRMAQPACARLRRQTRLDGSGSFNGYFRDSRWPTDSVQTTGRYQHGQKEGLFTQYHRNGQKEAEGRYQGNRRSGEWKFWYASGQPMEVLNYDANERETVLAYWSAAGQQLVTNGNGQWTRSLNQSKSWFSGPALNGRPTGTWTLTSPEFSNKVLLTETYGPDGSVVAGTERIVNLNRTEKYTGTSRVVFTQGRAFEAAEGFRMQPPCRTMGTAQMASNTFKPAFYRDGPSAYVELLWQRIRPIVTDPARNGVSPLTTYRGLLRFQVRLDVKGNWQNEPSQPEGTNIEAARQVLGIMRNLPRWQPAHQDGQPVESTVTVEYNAVLDRYTLNIKPGYSTNPSAAR